MLELQYLRARYYDVERGNFLTEDTYLGDISAPLTLNRYNYVVSNPLNYIDPSGFVSEYLTGPSYDPDDSWKANNYPLSQTGSEKTEFPVTVVSGIKAVRELWGSVSKGVANAANMISENVSHAVKNKVKDLMETAVKASVMIVCSDTVQLLNDVGNTIFSFIIGTVYGALEPASVLLDFLIDSGGYDSAAFELGRIVGNAAAVAAIFGMFFAGGGAISGAFMGGAMALSLGAAGAATVEIAAGATVIAAKGNSIAEALNSLIAEMSGASNSGGKGTEEEGESNTSDVDTPVEQGTSRPPKRSTPNSIYEQLNPDGTVRSRAYYDENGNQFSRQDFEHSHYDKGTQQDLQPHEHNYHYNENGFRDGESVGPVPPGYDNLPN